MLSKQQEINVLITNKQLMTTTSNKDKYLQDTIETSEVCEIN